VQVARAAPGSEAAWRVTGMLTVVIPVLDGVDHIDRCIASVHVPGVEVIVVDDGSTDGTADYVEERWPDVLVLRQDNKGPSAARNAGARVGSGDWIAFLDADDRVLPGWVEALSSGGPDHGVVTVAALMVRNGVRSTVPAAGIARVTEGVHGRFLAGTFALRQSIFTVIGGYDESMGFSENLELGFRVRDACDHLGLEFRQIDEELIEIRQAVDLQKRYSSYADRRALAARRMLSVHRERFANDPASRRTHWRIIAVVERQQGRWGRFVLAAARSYLARWL
jgi:glycosyltransferase involved in cell wall biosynthesis